ncbi:hypothetical protein [Bradyrhizobium sp. WSM1253]|uniref:hypothetical protein n=1 Tax=Bradyrhizobium sp. WSM1253 TaxID=319003 RepID=UPI00025D2DF6|nr:hypothetical protein [Bradyrhizobium sp. WSM1253]EIG63484.1 hypothetical protein Bra1253DRAFT_08459 [Bradyrhizobium sp. WSM1253]
MKRLFASALAFLALLPALAAAQTGPTLPANTVWGRTGTSPGPAQAIPFATLSAQMWGTVPNNTVLGNVSGSTALMASLNATQLTTLCNTFTTSLKGCVPASGGGTTTFLRADGTFATAVPTGGTQGQTLVKNSVTNGDASWRSQCLNITAFGGAGDGATANDTAFSNAYSALPATGGCIYFPAAASTYNFTSAVSKTMPNARFSLTIEGDGAVNSILHWPNASGGITLTASNTQNTFHIRNMTFSTAQVGSGTALHFVGVGANNGQYYQSDISNIQIHGDDIGTSTPTLHYWSTAIYIHNWAAIDISNTNTYGPHQAPASAGGGTGINIEGDSGTGSYATIINIARSSFNHHVMGMLLGSYWQGITCEACNFNGAVGNNCVLANGASGTNVLLNFTNSQFNCGAGGAQINLNQPVLDFTLMSSTITTAGNGNSGVLISGAGSLDPIIIGNNFNLFGSPTGTFCIASAGTNGIILGNSFSQCATPVNLTAASSNTGVSQNRYRSGASSASNVNGGTGNNMGTATQ